MSDAVGMGVGSDKVCHRSCQAWKVRQWEKLPSAKGAEDKTGDSERYWYLRIEQLFKADHANIREHLTKQYVKRLHRIWSSALNSKHKVHATNTWAVSVFWYFCPDQVAPQGTDIA